MKKPKMIANEIYGDIDEILKEIKKEDVAAYVFIMKEYRKGNILKNPLFRFVYQKFYGMNRFVTEKFKEEYFKNMERGENDLRKILKTKSDNKVQYSFSTKLLHTIDSGLPIFDTNVGKALSSAPSRGSIEGYVKHYEKIKKGYLELCKEPSIMDAISKFQQKFEGIGKISKEKSIDFLLWGYGKSSNAK